MQVNKLQKAHYNTTIKYLLGHTFYVQFIARKCH